MKRINFIAKTATFDVINNSYVAALSPADGLPGYLMLQRTMEGDPDDDGVYIEFFQEIASGYDLLSECQITRNKVRIELREPFAGIIGIDVSLEIADEPFCRYIEGVKKVFHGRLGEIIIDAQPSDAPRPTAGQ